MGEVVSAFGQILRASVSLKFYLYMFLLFVLTMVLGLLSGVVAILGGGILFLLALMFYGFWAFSLPALLAYAVLAVLFLLLLVLLGAFVDAAVEGLGVNLCRDFLTAKKLDLGAALKRMQPRLLDAVKLRFYVWMIVGLALLILFALPFLLAWPAFASLDLALLDFEAFAAPLVGVVILELVLALAVLLAAFFLAPFFVVLFQLPFFEEKSPRQCLDRALALGKRNYWRNLGFYLLTVVTLFAVFMFFGVFSFITGLFGALFESEALIALGIIIFLFMGVVMFFLRILVQAWAFGLNQLFLTGVYFLDTGKKLAKPKDVKLKV